MTRNCDFVIHRFVKYYSEYRPVDGIIATHAGVFRGARISSLRSPKRLLMALETLSRNKMNWTAVIQPLKNKSKLWIAVGFNVT